MKTRSPWRQEFQLQGDDLVLERQGNLCLLGCWAENTQDQGENDGKTVGERWENYVKPIGIEKIRENYGKTVRKL